MRLAALALLAAVTCAAAMTCAAADSRLSGFDQMSRELQEMQRDDAANPAMLWARDGEAAWSAKTGGAAKACADCHGAAEESMRGVSARYPAFDEVSGESVTLEGRINLCRRRHQDAPDLAPESDALLALSAFTALQSRGLPVSPPDDPRLAPARARGAALFSLRQGQLNLSCANCHETNAGGKLGGSLIPQAHPTGYPLYRLEWQALGSLGRRMRNCLIGVRAEPFAPGAREWTDLEAFLMSRAAGMKIDAPAVRP